MRRALVFSGSFGSEADFSLFDPFSSTFADGFFASGLGSAFARTACITSTCSVLIFRRPAGPEAAALPPDAPAPVDTRAEPPLTAAASAAAVAAADLALERAADAAAEAAETVDLPEDTPEDAAAEPETETETRAEIADDAPGDPAEGDDTPRPT